MELKDLKSPTKNKKKKRLGRGHASGRGKTSSRGHKGTGQRAGRRFYIGFEGGNVPFLRKIPKRGFFHKKKVDYQIVNLYQIEQAFSAGEIVSPQTLAEKNLIKDKAKAVKILAKGDLKKKLTLKAHKISAAAKAKVEASNSKFEVISL